jgi:hypothetical protein
VKPALPEDQLAEIPVGGHKNGTGLTTEGQHGIIWQTRVHLGDVGYVVPFTPKTFHNRAVNALVSQESHPVTRSRG